MYKKHGPWRIVKRVEKYKNPWLNVWEDKVIRPDGKKGIYGVVQMMPGVSVLPFDERGFVYLTKEFKYAMGKKSIEVVSGAVSKGEVFFKAAKRELEEELGIKAKQWTDLGVFHPITAIMFHSARLFLARDLEFLKRKPEGTETMKIIKIKLKRAVQMVLQGKITQGQSCILILKADQYLKTKQA